MNLVSTSDLQFTQTQFTGLSCLGGNAVSYHKLQAKPTAVHKFKDALQLTGLIYHRPLTML